ncbi:Protransforming growth factor alpha Transforming growth factor alpha [Larimichthys crocea]|uniref:Protransforming growth factor alpha Transforming growth factor alpha n=1 Tax=Larimichthys crocea TaxID=215358 RepID=A0A6G0J403_LARCR|nr:protransforming growth factor alpha isoform X1 [Larimichthys crocea]KAE8298499.1 Protransforming growth factor alpha Transforming growth factor alpha [Larimichthys crocea]
MMTRIFWDAIFLISGTFSMSVVLNGSLFTFGAGPSNSTIIEASISIDTNSTAISNISTSGSVTTSSRNTTTTTTVTTTTDAPPVKDSLFTLETETSDSTMNESIIFIETNFTAASNTSTSNSALTTTTTATSTTNIPPVKKFVAAAVRSHFDDCPDSHRHFCFHGSCRFLILEETPACVCHPGFVGMRCEHADLLAVVATNHRQQTVATVLVLCVIGCVLIMVLCTLLHCWWRQDCRRRRLAHHYVLEKHGAPCYPSESVV